MANDLLVDLQEEDYSDILENGALARRKVQPVIVSKYEHKGYYAGVMLYTCACGATYKQLQGLFSEKIAHDKAYCTKVEPGEIPDSALRETRLFRFSTKVCASCIGAYGFPTPDASPLKE